MVNASAFVNQTDIVIITQTINSESGGLFGFGILVAIYLITFFPLLKWGTKSAFATASFLGVVSAILLRLMSLITDPVLFGSIVLVCIAVLILYMSRE